MKQYLEIMEKILSKGKWKGNRTGIRTLTLPNQFFSHDMEDGFPAITTKKLAFKTMSVELEGFINGITDKKWYKDRNCNIWNEWANPDRVTRTAHDKDRMFQNVNLKDIQKEEQDLGPIYGYQWRKFGEDYPPYRIGDIEHGVDNGFDQFDYIVQTLKKNPDDRRMVCSAWNPNQLHLMALPPCHFSWSVTHIDGELNLHWTQRSCDLFLGVPFNIASYALLLELLCKESNLKPGNLSGTLCDCHIYENHIDQCKEQLSRSPLQLPTLEFSQWNGIYNWTHKDVVLKNYNHHTQIKAEVAV